jgi:glucuronate isomerase
MPASTLLHDDFLLQHPFAVKLYHEYAKGMPIIDYHNHLPPAQIATDHRFANISRAWLAGDHYKWRAMRTLGIGEAYITGNAPDEEKFMKWAEAVPYTVRNPLFHWTQLELKRYFDIDDLLRPENAQKVYEQTSSLLQQASHSTLGLLGRMNVEVVCTTDDPVDSLEHHATAQKDIGDMKVLPAFRPDKAYALADIPTFLGYMELLEEASGMAITKFADLLAALDIRMDYFHARGCRLSDHGLEHMPVAAGADPESVFAAICNGKALTTEGIQSFTYAILQHLCRGYHKRGWVQQFHLGALRNNNTRGLRELGPDTGFDSIGDFPQARSLSTFLCSLEESGELAKTILYNVNPADNEVMATMTGNFNDGSTRGKIQWGSAWWFLDQKDGMEKQLNTLSNMGLLSCFIGMLTDSRSFLSFPRHEYFRRALCNLIGGDVARGELPEDEHLLGNIVQDICYRNAAAYFPF